MGSFHPRVRGHRHDPRPLVLQTPAGRLDVHLYPPSSEVDQVQMDELFALLSAVKDGEITEAKAIKRLSRSPHWVWVAMDPISKLILAFNVGDRTLAMAQRLVHQVTQVLAPDCAPLFLTDGFRDYLTALDATARAALCTSRQVLPTSTHC